MPTADPPSTDDRLDDTLEVGERRHRRRSRLHLAWGILYGAFRAAYGRAHSIVGALGLVIVAGALVAAALTWTFALVAETVQEGETQRFDDAVLRWMAVRQVEWLEVLALEITTLGNGLVLAAIVIISGLFLWLTHHRWSAALLLVSTAGGIGLNFLLKASFDRPRPRLFEWGEDVFTASFPSGHAMVSAVVFATVAWLAARLQERRLSRTITMIAVAVLITLIGLSRMYLGVHYPTDVIAGITIGVAWAAFCMATLEAFQRFGRPREPDVLAEEEPSPAEEEELTGARSP